jgi:hypothetical protein
LLVVLGSIIQVEGHFPADCVASSLISSPLSAFISNHGCRFTVASATMFDYHCIQKRKKLLHFCPSSLTF